MSLFFRHEPCACAGEVVGLVNAARLGGPAWGPRSLGVWATRGAVAVGVCVGKKRVGLPRTAKNIDRISWKMYCQQERFKEN